MQNDGEGARSLRHFAAEGASVEVVEVATGAVADPSVVNRRTGRPLMRPDYVMAAGPAASAAIRERIARRNAQTDGRQACL